MGGSADRRVVSVVVVLYNSARHLPQLLESLESARAEADLHVVAVDNDSSDDSVAVARSVPGVTCVESGGNLGYAAGINIGRRHAVEGAPVLILNPDLTVTPGTVARLLAALEEPGVGVAVPTIVDLQGELYPSLHREPSVLRALADALLGSRLWPHRPPLLSEHKLDPRQYEVSGEADWASGAALLISADCDAAVGDWDERFFLYSEETDFFRRVRSAGFRVVHVPAARVVHEEGGSGTSPALVALMSTNRIRYFEKWHRRPAVLAFRAVVALGALLRARGPGHREALRCALSRQRWERLPVATRGKVPAGG